MKKANYPIIDACIACSASEKKGNVESSAALLCLNTIYNLKEIKITMTSQLKDEWLRNGSSYSKLWLSRMVSSKRTEIVVNNKLYNSLVGKIHNATNKKTLGERAKMLKDLHLFVGAMQSSHILISHNEKDGFLFQKYIEDTRIQNICWVSPKHKKDLKKWIEQGLPCLDTHRIKNYKFKSSK